MSSHYGRRTHNRFLGKAALAASFAVALGITPAAKPAIAEAAETPAGVAEADVQNPAENDESGVAGAQSTTETDAAEEAEDAQDVQDSETDVQLLAEGDETGDSEESFSTDEDPQEDAVTSAGEAVVDVDENTNVDIEDEAVTEAEAEATTNASVATTTSTASSTDEGADEADGIDAETADVNDGTEAEASGEAETANAAEATVGSANATLALQADEDGWQQYTNHGSSIEWKIDEDGKLTFRPIEGTTGVLRLYDEGSSHSYEHDTYWHGNGYGAALAPWNSFSYSQTIKSFAVADGCTIRCLGDLSFLFEDCGFTSIDLSGLDTSGVTAMAGLLHDCESLTYADLSQLDTSQVTDMNCMFHWCTNLTSVNLAGWDTSKVTDMKAMFRECPSLTSVDLSGFDTSNVTGMCRMFDSCFSLTSLDLSNFDTSNVTDMYGMFKDCSALETLDISSFVVSDDCYVADMFAGTTALQEVKLGDGFKFVTFESALLETPSGDGYTGRWVRVGADGAYLDPAYAPENLRDNWASSLAGTWVWERVDAPKPNPTSETKPAQAEEPKAEPVKPMKPAKHVPAEPVQAALPQTGDPAAVATMAATSLAGMASVGAAVVLRRRDDEE